MEVAQSPYSVDSDNFENVFNSRTRLIVWLAARRPQIIRETRETILR